MAEHRHDIMAIFREAAAADKVCLHAAPLRVYTHPGRGGTTDSAGARLETLEPLGTFHSLKTSLGYFGKSIVNSYNCSTEQATVAG